MIKELLLILVGAVCADSLILGGAFGVSSLGLNVDRKRFAISVALTLIVMSLLAPIVGGMLVSAEYLLVLVLVVLSMLTAFVCCKLILGEKLGASWILVLLNTLVLGTALTGSDMSPVQSLFFGIGSALGFWILLEVFASMKLRFYSPKVPKALRGAPVTVLAAGIISMVIYAF